MVYGSPYVGWRDVALYAKYDLNPILRITPGFAIMSLGFALYGLAKVFDTSLKASQREAFVFKLYFTV